MYSSLFDFIFQKEKIEPVQPPYLRLEHVDLFYDRDSRFSFDRKSRLRRSKRIKALNDVSFSIEEGETVGIVGRNGSGKSTLSRILSHLLFPSSGSVDIAGKVQLLSLGVGFKPKLTGRENAYLSGALLGISRKEMDQKIEEIEQFAELNDFFYEPVRTYSSGMKSRLGFAVSTVVQPDILVLDEVFSTGDDYFREKAYERMEQMRSRTGIVVIISHSIQQVRTFCSRVIWLEKGFVVMDGKPDEILNNYKNFCADPAAWKKRHSS